jgi:hypothetical protein
MRNENKPCYGCADRKVGCHSRCVKYKKAKEYWDKRKGKDIREEIFEYRDYLRGAIKRMSR